MAKMTVEMAGYMGKPFTVTGDVKNGLIVHKNGKMWCVSHIASGLGVGPATHLKRDVVERRERLLGMLGDWSAKDLCDLAKVAGFDDLTSFVRRLRECAY